MAKGPILFDIDPTAPAPSPADAAPVPEPQPEGRAMQTVAAIATRRPNRLVRAFWQLLLAILTFAAGLLAWDFTFSLLDRNPVLGAIAAVLVLAFLLVCAGLAIRELSAFARLKRLDRLQAQADAAIGANDTSAARAVTDQLKTLYAARPEVEWGLARFRERDEEQFDADAVLGLAESELLAPLDALARREVEAAARQVATVTAIVPLALADLLAALTANLRMIRRIAEIYGGRSGALGNWRLTRAVFTHLVATGAVAVGDDLIGSLAGGGALAKVSRRFGEGVVNGALTARVGIAAIEVCRPLPFRRLKRPRVTSLLQRALTGLFPSVGRGAGAGDVDGNVGGGGNT
ncbi:YcjF family protein [Aliiroseovarius sp. PTFE2010]|uniref:YcjF family protein n=1 Tax=Aliiroseovarius sp. PTFE2010 TaxID=3417190 RepID=UPI003CFB60A7